MSKGEGSLRLGAELGQPCRSGMKKCRVLCGCNTDLKRHSLRARNKTTLAVEALLDGEAETITRRQLAKAGDRTALRLCLDRIAPPRKDRPLAFELPPITSSGEAAKASAALVAAVAVGDLTPSEAADSES